MPRVPEPHKICEGRKPISREEAVEICASLDQFILPHFLMDLPVMKRNYWAILKKNELTMTNLAKSLGIEKATLSAIMNMNNNRALNVAHIENASRYIHCTCSELLLGEARPVRAPKLLSVLYRAIEQKEIRDFAQETIDAMPVINVDTGTLIRDRLTERASDAAMLPIEYYSVCLPELRTALKPMLLKGTPYVGRASSLYALCLVMDESVDFLVCQDYSSAPIMFGTTPIEDKYRRLVGRFVSLNMDQQKEAIAKIVAKQIQRGMLDEK